MLHWKVLVFTVLLCHLYTCTAGQRNKVLYPGALIMKRGVVHPTILNSVEDSKLLFEILLAGVRMGDGRGCSTLSMQDEELASMRQTHALASVCEDVLPRELTDIRRLTYDLSRHSGCLRGPDFERTVLTMVYAAHKLAGTRGQQRERWAESFLSLFKAIKQDLTVR